MSKNENKWLESLGISLASMVILSYVAYIKKYLGIFEIVTTLFLFSITIIIVVYIVVKTKNSFIEKDFRMILDSHATLADKFSWLRNQSSIVQFESDYDGREIWVVSAELEHDGAQNSDFLHLVIKNIKDKKIEYVYFIQNEDYTKERANSLIEEFEEKGVIPPLFYVVQKSRFDKLANTDIIIYSPTKKNGKKTEVFLELPVDLEPSKRLWVKIDENLAVSAIKQVSTMKTQAISTLGGEK